MADPKGESPYCIAILDNQKFVDHYFPRPFNNITAVMFWFYLIGPQPLKIDKKKKQHLKVPFLFQPPHTNKKIKRSKLIVNKSKTGR